MPFQLFRLGDGREVHNTVTWGVAPDGMPVRAFDYSYYTESSDNGSINPHRGAGGRRCH